MAAAAAARVPAMLNTVGGTSSVPTIGSSCSSSAGLGNIPPIPLSARGIVPAIPLSARGVGFANCASGVMSARGNPKTPRAATILQATLELPERPVTCGGCSWEYPLSVQEQRERILLICEKEANLATGDAQDAEFRLEEFQAEVCNMESQMAGLRTENIRLKRHLKEFVLSHRSKVHCPQRSRGRRSRCWWDRASQRRKICNNRQQLHRLQVEAAEAGELISEGLRLHTRTAALVEENRELRATEMQLRSEFQALSVSSARNEGELAASRKQLDDLRAQLHLHPRNSAQHKADVTASTSASSDDDKDGSINQESGYQSFKGRAAQFVSNFIDADTVRGFQDQIRDKDAVIASLQAEIRSMRESTQDVEAGYQALKGRVTQLVSNFGGGLPTFGPMASPSPVQGMRSGTFATGQSAGSLQTLGGMSFPRFSLGPSNQPEPER